MVMACGRRADFWSAYAFPAWSASQAGTGAVTRSVPFGGSKLAGKSALRSRGSPYGMSAR